MNMLVNLEQIVTSEKPIRTTWSEEEMQQLTESIKQWGVIQAVKLRPLDDDYYEIVDGHRRIEAARRAGLEYIEATIEGMDDQTALIQSLIANVQREDMSPLDKACGLQSIQKVTGWSNMEIQRRGIMNNMTVSRLLSLLEEPPEIQSMLSQPRVDNELSYRHINEVSKTIENDDDKIGILQKAANEGMTREHTLKVAEAVKVADELGDEDAKQALLQKPYAEKYHDPVRVREHLESAKEDGRRSASYTTKPMPEVVDEWELLYEASDVLDGINDLINAIPDYVKVAEIGKLSPEGQRFLSRKIGMLIVSLTNFQSKIDNGEYNNE
jgi:ParB/RepB/Spo0J family partition protein